MSVSDKVSIVLGELCANRKKLKDGQLDRLVEAVRGSRHIFIAGTGRSGLAMRAFANRLGHLGFDVSCIGEISSPHSKEGDLLIIGSGSGETDSLVALARKAKRNRVSVALLTIGDDSTIAGMADLIVQLPGVTPKRVGGEADEEPVSSVQPMGSAFEQMLFLVCDSMILELMERMGQTSDEMFDRHADLE